MTKTRHIFLTIPLCFILLFQAQANSPKPTSALSYQQATNTRIVVEENYLRFFTAGSERMIVDVSGNVGIGYSSFDWGTALDGLVVNKGVLVADPDNPAFTYADSHNPSSWSFRSILRSNTEKLTFESNFGGVEELMTFDSQARIGIGTLTPQTKFHVQNGGNAGVALSNSDMIVEANDALLDLISSPDATWGSAINFVEGTADGSANTDVWSIARQTTGESGDSSLRFNFGTNNTHTNANKLTLNADGKVGIGITSPSDGMLHVYKNATTGGWGGITPSNAGIRVQDNGSNLYIDGNTLYTSGVMHIGTMNNNYFTIGTNDEERVRVAANGRVGIGTTSPSQKLDVNGNINATKYYAAGVQAWPDYVFEDSYKLNEIEEVEKYIEKNHHLPEIPSAVEVKENGIDIVEMQAKLLQKIEELTLYVIEQNKQIQAQQKEIEKLKATQE